MNSTCFRNTATPADDYETRDGHGDVHNENKNAPGVYDTTHRNFRTTRNPTARVAARGSSVVALGRLP